MLTTYKVTLLIILVISAIGVMGEKKDLRLQRNMMLLGVASMISFIVTHAYF